MKYYPLLLALMVTSVFAATPDATTQIQQDIKNQQMLNQDVQGLQGGDTMQNEQRQDAAQQQQLNNQQQQQQQAADAQQREQQEKLQSERQNDQQTLDDMRLQNGGTNIYNPAEVQGTK